MRFASPAGTLLDSVSSSEKAREREAAEEEAARAERNLIWIHVAD